MIISRNMPGSIYHNNGAMYYIAYNRGGLAYQYANEALCKRDRNDNVELLHIAWQLSVKHQSAIVHHYGTKIRFYYSTMSSGRDTPSCCQRWKSILYSKPEGSGYLEYNIATGQLSDNNNRSLGLVDINIFKTMVASMYSGTGSNFILFNTEMMRKPALDDELFFEESTEHLTEWIKNLTN